MGRRFFVLFLYDCGRLMVWAECAARVLFAPEGALAFIPLAVFASPSVLFPLMSFFVWRGDTRYAVFKPLYVAGKCSLCAFQAAGIAAPFLSGRLSAGGALLSLSGTTTGPLLPAFAVCAVLDLASALLAATAPRAGGKNGGQTDNPV